MPSPASGWSSPTTPRGFPCCARFPCVRAVATTPAQPLAVLPRSSGQRYQPSPEWLPGRPVHRPFRGLLSVHSRYGPHTRAATNSWLAYPKASDISSPPCLLRLLPAGAVAGWGLHPLESAAFSRRTPSSDIRCPELVTAEQSIEFTLWAKSAKEIAQVLGCSPATVHFMRSRWAKTGHRMCDARVRSGWRYQHLSSHQDSKQLAPFARSTRGGWTFAVGQLRRANRDPLSPVPRRKLAAPPSL